MARRRRLGRGVRELGEAEDQDGKELDGEQHAEDGDAKQRDRLPGQVEAGLEVQEVGGVKPNRPCRRSAWRCRR
ncbi:hypothetical protein ACFYTC_35155 [Actinomadura nitritigenes]|uniref:hypothetical protein n=1 Tax=Actinomadura nitritigenes TaxID=134602 RepID=UPI0036B8ED92